MAEIKLCDRCRDPNRVDTSEYTITKTSAAGEDEKQKRTLCGSCAQITKDAGFKLTGGKAPEAEPSEPGPKAREETADPKDQEAIVNDKPVRRRY